MGKYKYIIYNMSWSELCFSNANTGYLEGLLRGLRSGFLNVEG